MSTPSIPTAEECQIALKKDYSELTDSDLNKISDEIDAIQSKFKDDKSLMNKAIKEYVTAHEADLKHNSLTFIRNKIKQQRLRTEIVNNSKDFTEAYKKLESVYVGDNSIESSQKSRMGKYESQLFGKLKESGVESHFISGQYDAEVRSHAFDVARGGKGSADPTVVKIYDSIKAVNDSIYTDWHMAGLQIKYRKDFVSTRRFDTGKLVASNEADFVKLAMQTIKKDFTFTESVIASGNEGMEKVLKELYKDMVDSRTQYVIQDDVNKTYLRKLKSRRLEFNSAADQELFMQAFGVQESLADAMFSQLDISAKNIEVSKKLGTNFDDSFKTIANEVKRKYAKTDTQGMSPEQAKKVMDKMESKLNKLEGAHKHLTSPPYAPTTEIDSAISFFKNVATFSKLQSSIITNLYDTNSSALQYTLATGENQAIGMMKTLSNIGGLIISDKAAVNELADLLQVHSNFVDYSLIMGGSARDLKTGLNRTDKFFAWWYDKTLVPQWTRLNKINNAINMSYAFEKMTKIGYDNLDPLLKANADRYKLNQADFDYMQKFVVPNKKRGVLSPASIYDVSTADVMKHYGIDSEVKASRIRDDLYTKYSNFVNDAVYKGSPTSTTKEKLDLGRLSQDATLRRASAIVTQFKETPYRILLNNVDAYKRINAAYGSAGVSRELFSYLTMGLMTYTAIESFRRLLFNQQSLTDQLKSGDRDSIRRLVMDFANKSAIAPIIADLVDASTSPNKTTDITSYLAGPNLNMAVDAGNVIKAVGSPTEGSVLKEGSRFLGRHVLPNHFVPKAILRHLEIDMATLQKIRK